MCAHVHDAARVFLPIEAPIIPNRRVNTRLAAWCAATNAVGLVVAGLAQSNRNKACLVHSDRTVTCEPRHAWCTATETGHAWCTAP